MLYTREIINSIAKVLSREEFIILTGARQTGKTSILLLIKQILEKQKETCFYFNLEDPDFLTPFNQHPFNLFEFLPDSKNKLYVFIDEIQYLDHPSRFLKLLFDEKRTQIKIITTGSSSFYIDKKFKDSLVGRKFLFEIYPLNFSEFLTFNDREDLRELQEKKINTYYRKELQNLYQTYFTFGGYPKVALTKDLEIKKIILGEIGASYVKKDVIEAGLKSPEKYFSLLRVLAGQTGQLLNIQELSKSLKISHKTVEEYLYVMQKSYQVALIRPFYRNIKKELTKMPKVYFYDLGLRNFFLKNYEALEQRVDKGQFLENIVFKEFLHRVADLDKINFWRTQDKKEVDFVLDKEAYEIKYNQKKIKKNRYQSFLEQYPEINLQFISSEDVLPRFYGYEM